MPNVRQNRIKLLKNTSEMLLFPAQAPLEAVAIDLLAELIRTSRGNEYLLALIGRFTKRRNPVPLNGTPGTKLAKAFVTDWMFSYWPTQALDADNGGCFTWKCFQNICQIMNIPNSYTTMYHHRANGKVEQFNRTIKAMIRAYLADHPTDCNLCMDTLTLPTTANHIPLQHWPCSTSIFQGHHLQYLFTRSQNLEEARQRPSTKGGPGSRKRSTAPKECLQKS